MMQRAFSLAAALMLGAAMPNMAHAAPDNTLGMALMSATVESDGTLVHGSGVTGSVRTGIGDFTVTFDRDLAGCSCTASAGHSSLGPPPVAGIIASANCPGTGANNLRVIITTALDTGTFKLDAAFHAIVFCPK